MIRVELKNGAVLLFHEYEKITTVEWISDDGKDWSDWRTVRAESLLEHMERGGERFIIERINPTTGVAVVKSDWLSPVASVRNFTPLAFT